VQYVKLTVCMQAERVIEFYEQLSVWLLTSNTRLGERPKARSPSSNHASGNVRYQALTRYLASVYEAGDDKLELRFHEIEELLGHSLPVSARRHRSFWANGRGSPQGSAWLSIGWKVVLVELASEIVQLQRFTDG
jgi:hypothetical protein